MASWQEILSPGMTHPSSVAPSLPRKAVNALTDQTPTNKAFDTGDSQETFNALYSARNNPEAIDRHGARNLANAEHEAFAYDAVKKNPLMAASLMVAIPGYDAAKRLGFMTDEKTSAPGIDQMAAGYQGMWRGLKDSDATWQQILGVEDDAL